MKTKKPARNEEKQQEKLRCAQEKNQLNIQSHTKMNGWNGKQTKNVMALFYVVLNW